MSKPSIFAHRGASSVRFENTMKAFELAVSQGADGIEIDVQVSEDGVLFVIHDLVLSRLAGIRRSISSMTGVEVKRIRVGRKYTRLFAGHRIPTLIEVVSFCQSNHLALNVELKESISERPEYIKQILDIITHVEEVHISSFDYELLEKVRRSNPQIETAYLLRKNSVEWANLEQYSCADGFHISKRLLKEPYLKNLILTGKKIRVYGITGSEPIAINPPPYIDGWITDYPDRFKN